MLQSGDIVDPSGGQMYYSPQVNSGMRDVREERGSRVIRPRSVDLMADFWRAILVESVSRLRKKKNLANYFFFFYGKCSVGRSAKKTNKQKKKLPTLLSQF